jgi:hypothetical protein
MLNNVCIGMLSLSVASCSADRVDVDINPAWFKKSCDVQTDCVSEKIYDVCGVDCPDVVVHRDFQAEIDALRQEAAETCGGGVSSEGFGCFGTAACIEHRCVHTVGRPPVTP